MTKKTDYKKGKIIKAKSKWIHPYKDHPADKLKVRLILNEKIKGNRVVGLEARIEPGDVHQLHTHDTEYVLVYTINGRCKVTVGNETKTVHPHTMIFIPPKIPHRFENKYSKRWDAIAFAFGNKSKIKNVWMD